MRLVIFLLVVLLSCSNSFAQNYTLKGSAELVGKDCYRLTRNVAYQSGAVWHSSKINLQERFDIEFLMNFGTNDENGADGMTFIMQTAGNQAIGHVGEALGFAGFLPSLGVEFDTYQNANLGDPDFDHIAIISNGSTDHNDKSSLVKFIQALPDNPNIEDGKEHLIRITWEPSTHLIEVYFDCQKRVSYTKDIVKDIFNGQPTVFWGFSGSTGLYTNDQTVCLSQKILFNNKYTVCPGQSINLVGRTIK